MGWLLRDDWKEKGNDTSLPFGHALLRHVCASPPDLQSTAGLLHAPLGYGLWLTRYET